MPNKKKVHPTVKTQLHPRNKHRSRYDFKQLVETLPELESVLELNKYNDESIDFFNPVAVKLLNTALLKHYYGVEYWAIPLNYLCPPIPGRADYIHYLATLLGESNDGKVPEGSAIKCLDIGVGANCIYPIIGHQEYGWTFVGSDIDPTAVKSAQKIVDKNAFLKDTVEIRLQENPKAIFNKIIQAEEYFDLTICNPPFHSSEAEAKASSVRKLRNLKHKNVRKPVLNFGGQGKELWCNGGEALFIRDMVHESKEYASSCYWFSTLVSKEEHLKGVYKQLRRVKALDTVTLEMGQGNKVSRIVCWTFMDAKKKEAWRKTRWEG